MTTVPRSTVISYLAILLLLILVGWLRLATPLLTVLFSYFALTKLRWWRIKWPAVALFLILVAAIFYGFVLFLRRAFIALPDIVSTAVPIIVHFADRQGIDLPFTDLPTLKDIVLESVRGTLGYLGNFAKIATKEFVSLVIGVVIAIGIFLHPEPNLGLNGGMSRTDLYSFYSELLAQRFGSFYRSFERVMGAQLLISAINTTLTAIFVLATSLPYSGVVIALTFVCGLLPVIGNIISNTVIVGLAFTKSPQLAGWALAFLVIIHKLEYFLNSKIIGSRIRHPMWLMLLALILGERLMGIPGIIIAPVILSFVKVEASQYDVMQGASAEAPAPQSKVGK